MVLRGPRLNFGLIWGAAGLRRMAVGSDPPAFLFAMAALLGYTSQDLFMREKQ